MQDTFNCDDCLELIARHSTMSDESKGIIGAICIEEIGQDGVGFITLPDVGDDSFNSVRVIYVFEDGELDGDLLDPSSSFHCVYDVFKPILRGLNHIDQINMAIGYAPDIMVHPEQTGKDVITFTYRNRLFICSVA